MYYLVGLSSVAKMGDFTTYRKTCNKSRLLIFSFWIFPRLSLKVDSHWRSTLINLFEFSRRVLWSLNIYEFKNHGRKDPSKEEYIFLLAGKVLHWDRKARRQSFFSAREFSFSEIGRLSKSSVARFWQSRSRKRKILSRKRRAWEVLSRGEITFQL